MALALELALTWAGECVRGIMRQHGCPGVLSGCLFAFLRLGCASWILLVSLYLLWLTLERLYWTIQKIFLRVTSLDSAAFRLVLSSPHTIQDFVRNYPPQRALFIFARQLCYEIHIATDAEDGLKDNISAANHWYQSIVTGCRSAVEWLTGEEDDEDTWYQKLRGFFKKPQEPDEQSSVSRTGRFVQKAIAERAREVEAAHTHLLTQRTPPSSLGRASGIALNSGGSSGKKRMNKYEKNQGKN